jgi:hypothetical protein
LVVSGAFSLHWLLFLLSGYSCQNLLYKGDIMNKFIKSGALVAVLTMGCAQGTVSEPSVCDSQSVSWDLTKTTLPNVVSPLPCQQVSATLPPFSTTVPFNFSDALNSVSKVASNLHVAINQLMIDNPTADFSWVQNVDVKISRDSIPGDAPVALASYTVPDAGAGSELNINVVMSSDTIFQYLESGKLTLTITLSAATVNGCTVAALINMGKLNGTVHMCVSASGDVSKTL